MSRCYLCSSCLLSPDFVRDPGMGQSQIPGDVRSAFSPDNPSDCAAMMIMSYRSFETVTEPSALQFNDLHDTMFPLRRKRWLVETGKPPNIS